MRKALIAIPIVVVAIIVSVAMSLDSDMEMPMDTGMEMEDSVMPMEAGLEGTVNIGLLLPLSGDLASHGEEEREAALLAVSDFNDYLVDKGSMWSFNAIVEDSETKPVAALEKVQGLFAKNTKVVIGPATSAALRNTMGYTSANGIIMISHGSTAPSLAIPNDNVFRTVPNDNNQGPAIANLMMNSGIEVLVPVWRGDTWGDGLREATARAFAEAGGVVDDGIRYNPEAPEFSASTSLLANQVQGYVDEYGKDKVGVLIIAFAEVLQFMQSANSHEVLDEISWFGSDGSTNEQSLVEDPIGLEFALATNFTTLQFGTTENATTERVTNYIMEELGRIPNVYAYSAYDAVWLAGLTIEATQTTDTAIIQDNIISVAENHVGAVGSTKLTEQGDLAASDYDIWTIQDDQWVIVGRT